MSHPLPASACPDCGAAQPPEQSLCPACLMRQALASRTVARNGDKTPQLTPSTPEEIADRFPGYEILECLGRGGMGAVYKARQKSLNRLVAIKILAPERVGEGRFAERFTIEAELLAKLGHPHIVTIHDFGETGGLFYLVMEFIDGVNLRDLLRDGKLEPQQALAIVPPICDALQYAHDKGIVHRDIKPENILLDRDGRVKIADFGIASLVGASGENSGTPPYMAPEQSGGTVDRRADIYALGVVLYEMLTGERPEKDLMAPSSKVQLDVKIDEIVLRALEKEPERRYQTAGEFRTMVETMAATPSEPKRDETSFAGEKRQEGRGRVLLAQIEAWAARYGWLSVIAIGLGLLIILGAIANFHFSLGVGKTPMMMVGSIFVAGGIIGAAIGSGRNRSGEGADSAYGDQEDFRKQNKRPRPSAMSAVNPRFSRPAMVGAVWATLALGGVVVVGLGVALPLILRNKKLLAENERQFAVQADNAEQTGAQHEKTLSEYDWDEQAKEGRLVDGEVVTVDGRTALKIENLQDEPKLARLLTIVSSPIKAKRYAIRGEIRYVNVQGAAYLEMWNDFPRGRFFSRTLDEPGSGPMAQITGNSDWRPFILPFDQMRIANTPNRIEVNLHLPGRGVVFVGPLELIELGTEQVTEEMEQSKREERNENPESQDAKVAEMAEAWLSGIDAGRYETSWNEAAEFFQNSITVETWAEAVTKFREPLGELKSRKFKDSQNADALPGAPDGKYVIMQFDTSFAAKARAVETVTFMLEKDGSWKAAGYLIR